MANSKISGLPIATSTNGIEVTPIVQSGTTKQLAIGKIRDYILGIANSFTGDQTLSTGNLVIGTSGKGIDFSATSNGPGTTSELLDDYEEGEYTVTLTPSTSGSITLSVSHLGYTKIGRVVTVTGWLIVGSVSSPVGSSITASLPFTVANTGGSSSAFGGTCGQNTSGLYVPTTVEANEGATVFTIDLDASTVSAGHRFKFSFSYFGA